MMPVIPLTNLMIGLFWKISSFQIYPLRQTARKIVEFSQADRPIRRAAMSHHSTSFEAALPVSAGTAQQLLPRPEGAAPVPLPAIPIKNRLRRFLMAGAAVAVLAGATWYGWNYWTVGRFLVSTDDAYVKADNTTIAPKVSGYLHEVL